MRYPVPPLEAVHTFEAAARWGSFTAAGEELRVSTSTVSHRVRQLEEHLDTTLFDRGARSLRLTDAGKAYLPVAQRVLDELATATTSLFTASSGGRVTVRVPMSYGTSFLARRLHDATEQLGVEVRTVSAIWGRETGDAEVDLSIELREVSDVAADDVVLGEEDAVLIGHPSVTAGRSPTARGPAPATSLRDGARVNVLGFEHLWEALEVRGSATILGLDVGLTVDSWSTAVEIVAAEPRRCALVPRLLTHGAVADGRVTRVTTAAVPLRRAYVISRPGTTSATPQATAFRDWLVEQHRSVSVARRWGPNGRAGGRRAVGVRDIVVPDWTWGRTSE